MESSLYNPSPAFLHFLCCARISSSFNRMFFDEKLVLKLFISNKFFRAVWKSTFHVSAAAEKHVLMMHWMVMSEGFIATLKLGNSPE